MDLPDPDAKSPFKNIIVLENHIELPCKETTGLKHTQV